MQQTIPHDRIRPNPDQPRKTFDRKELEDLAASIRENGLIQPITVRPVDAGMFGGAAYEIVAGERRWRAHGILIEQGYEPARSVSCNVREMNDATRDIEAIIENLQRVDVKPLEEGRAFQRMLDMGMSMETLAKKLGRPLWRVEERVRLMNLDPQIMKLCEGDFDHHVAQEIARLPAHRDQIAIVQMWNKGAIVGFKALKAAINAKIEALSQTDMFGEAPRASDEDVKVVNRMEEKIETMARLAAAGWKDGECIVATKVSRDRARLMAEKINAMRAALFRMEGELRAAQAQHEVVLAA